MPTRVSKILLSIELVLIGLVTVPVLLIFTLAAAADATKSLAQLALFVMMLALTSFVFAAFRVTAAFLSRGVQALHGIHKVWWYLSFAGVAYSVLGPLSVRLDGAMRFMDGGIGYIIVVTGLFGLLYLIPLVHVLMELLFRKCGAHAA
jgi:hypothetical protein